MKAGIISIILAMAAAAIHAASPPAFTTDDLAHMPADSLVARAVAAGQLADMLEAAEEAIFSPLSPLYSEERMALILRRALDSGKLDDTQTSTALWMLNDVCLVNAPDSLAANIDLELADGSTTNLHAYLAGRPLAVVFYDPDCRHCHSVMGQLGELASLVNVIAVCVDSPHSRWEVTRGGIPDGWVPAFDLSKVTETDAYVIRSLPSVYLLDADRRVRLKNPSPERLLDELKGGPRP